MTGPGQPAPTARSGPSGPRIRGLPLAVEHRDDIAGLLRGRRPAVFLDYDGTLTPIVEDPARALLPIATREALQRLAASCPVAVISGRDLDDVRALIGIRGLWYSGSHGFDIAGPGGERYQKASEFLPALDAAERELRAALSEIPGAHVERKWFALAVHYRQVVDAGVEDIEAAVESVARAHDELRRTGGKKVFELRPAIPWDKGRALAFLLHVLGLDESSAFPVFVGDDVTDEDAFRVVRDRGLGVVVMGEDDERTTLARYAVRDTDEARAFIEMLAGLPEAAG